MGIVSKTNCCKPCHSKPYPKLMQGTSGSIYLMTGHGVGTLVVKTDRVPWNIGTYKTDWNTLHLSDYNGSVTLQNQ